MPTIDKYFQYHTGARWVDLPKGAYKAAVEAGRPVRIFYTSGSFKVLKNAENLPKSEQIKNSVKTAAKTTAADFKLLVETSQPVQPAVPVAAPVIKKRGRPFGSKNKPKAEPVAVAVAKPVAPTIIVEASSQPIPVTKPVTKKSLTDLTVAKEEAEARQFLKSLPSDKLSLFKKLMASIGA